MLHQKSIRSLFSDHAALIVSLESEVLEPTDFWMRVTTVIWAPSSEVVHGACSAQQTRTTLKLRGQMGCSYAHGQVYDGN